MDLILKTAAALPFITTCWGCLCNFSIKIKETHASDSLYVYMCTRCLRRRYTRVGSLSGFSLAIVDTLISYTTSRHSWLSLLCCRAIASGPVTHVNRPAVPCPLKTSSATPERQHLDPECRSSWQSGNRISLGNELKTPTLQSLQRSMSPVLEWVAGSAVASTASALLCLEGNYRDKYRDSEGNTPGFQRDCYQDGAEQQPRDCTVFTSIVYVFIAKDCGVLNHRRGRGRNEIWEVNQRRESHANLMFSISSSSSEH